MKAFAGDKWNVVEIRKFALENIVGKGENDGYQHFLLFPKMFTRALFLGVVKSRDSVVKF